MVIEKRERKKELKECQVKSSRSECGLIDNVEKEFGLKEEMVDCVSKSSLLLNDVKLENWTVNSEDKTLQYEEDPRCL
jgi:hypothetical protein